MKEFFKFTLASMLGVFLASIIMTLIGIFFLFIFIAGLSSFESGRITEVEPNSILEIQLNYPVPERTITAPLPGGAFPFIGFYRSLGLDDILSSIENAGYDPNIKGIFLNLNNAGFSNYATLEPIRRALIDFKESGKFIIAHGDYITQKGYYIAATADKIYLTPSGNLDFKGLSAELFFFKKTLDKLEIDPQMFYFGKYKSATEPFRLSKMSDENREQTSSILSSMYDHIISEIAKARNIPENELKKIADNFSGRLPEEALRLSLIDSLLYRDQVNDELKLFAGVDLNKKLPVVSITDYSDVKSQTLPATANRIAVIYAVGEIEAGEGDNETIGTKNIIEALHKARLNKNVKAIVLRVNSPGGVFSTSDLIRREVALAADEKPLVVSMGSLAASGGYFISCPADKILAEQNTITGSIGAYGFIPNMKDFFENILGITFDRVKLGQYSDFGTVTRPFTGNEKKLFQSEIDRIYDQFIEKVVEGRDISKNKINEIAQGRVYTGIQAKELGLVDEIGGLNEAVEIAADMANIGQYRLLIYPELKSPFELIEKLFFNQAEESFLKLKLGEFFKYYEILNKVTNMTGIQARIPFEFEIN